MNLPLNLPAGSVRAILAITIVCGTLLLIGLQYEIPSELWMAFGMVTTTYYSARQTESK